MLLKQAGRQAISECKLSLVLLFLSPFNVLSHTVPKHQLLLALSLMSLFPCPTVSTLNAPCNCNQNFCFAANHSCLYCAAEAVLPCLAPRSPKMRSRRSGGMEEDAEAMTLLDKSIDEFWLYGGKKGASLVSTDRNVAAAWCMNAFVSLAGAQASSLLDHQELSCGGCGNLMSPVTRSRERPGRVGSLTS